MTKVTTLKSLPGPLPLPGLLPLPGPLPLPGLLLLLVRCHSTAP